MKNIWFVDDDVEMSHAISLILRLLGYDMRAFHDARSTVRALKLGDRPDVLILDISMPEVSGVDLLEFIRRRMGWNDFPILMLSSEATDAQVDQALELGANGFVAKPVTIEELEAAIEKALSTNTHPAYAPGGAQSRKE
ncbi:MAG TPA: response regulator [Anaerolineales bacterium]|nr:response regulator [Anaerolineales bacterium]